MITVKNPNFYEYLKIKFWRNIDERANEKYMGRGLFSNRNLLKWLNKIVFLFRRRKLFELRHDRLLLMRVN